MNRRTVLAGAGAALSASIAGCSGILPGGDEKEYSFSLYNGSQDAHSFQVQIGNELGGPHFYDETHELNGGTADEDVPLDDVPVHIFVSTDSSDSHEFRWPASYATEGEIASAAEIYYESNYHQNLFVLS